MNVRPGKSRFIVFRASANTLKAVMPILLLMVACSSAVIVDKIKSTKTKSACDSSKSSKTPIMGSTKGPKLCIAATDLKWVEASPQSATAVTASWTKSPSNLLANQKIQFYTGPACDNASGPLLDLNSATSQSQTFSGTAGSTFSYTITSFDADGGSLASSCSTAMTIEANNQSEGTTPPPSTPPPERYNIYVSLQSFDSKSKVYQFSYRYADSSVTAASSVNLSATLPSTWNNNGIRGMAVLPDKTILISHQSSDFARLNADLTLAGTGIWNSDATSPMPGTLGICVLPTGNLVFTGHRWTSPPSLFKEYTSSGTFVRTVSTNIVDGSECAAIGNQRLIWIEYDANNDRNSKIRVSELSGNSWADLYSWDTQIKIPSLIDSNFYSFVAHTNGYSYFFPGTLTGARNQKILRCLSAGDLSDCTFVGADLRNAHPDLDIIQGAKQLKGRDEMIFASSTSRKLYVFNPNNNATTELGDLAALGLPTFDDPYGLRDIVIMPDDNPVRINTTLLTSPTSTKARAADIDSANGFLYVAGCNGSDTSRPIEKIRLSDFTVVATLTIPAMTNCSRGAAIDVAGGHIYFAEDNYPSGRIHKIRLSDFTLVQTLTLATSYPPGPAVIDGGFLYVGINEWSVTPVAQLFKISLANFTVTDSLTLPTGGKTIQAATLDAVNHKIYLGAATSPTRIEKIDLATFTHEAELTLNTGENSIKHALAIDPVEGMLYAGTFTSPTKLVKIRLSDFTRVAAISVGASGESNIMTIDPTTRKAYLSINLAPAKISRIDLANFAVDGSVTLTANENYPLTASRDTTTGYLYFGIQGPTYGGVTKIK